MTQKKKSCGDILESLFCHNLQFTISNSELPKNNNYLLFWILFLGWLFLNIRVGLSDISKKACIQHQPDNRLQPGEEGLHSQWSQLCGGKESTEESQSPGADRPDEPWARGAVEERLPGLIPRCEEQHVTAFKMVCGGLVWNVCVHIRTLNKSVMVIKAGESYIVIMIHLFCHIKRIIFVFRLCWQIKQPSDPCLGWSIIKNRLMCSPR